MRLDVGELCKLRRILQMTSGYLTSIPEWGLGVLGTKAGKVWGCGVTVGGVGAGTAHGDLLLLTLGEGGELPSHTVI